MKVLSLFDGISCGKVALERAKVHINEYHASEIKRQAISVSEQNHNGIIRHGSVVNYHHCGHVDFCRYLTIAEMEVAQTLPEGYTKGLSHYASCDVLGNAFTVDVMAHILKGMTNIKSKGKNYD